MEFRAAIRNLLNPNPNSLPKKIPLKRVCGKAKGVAQLNRCGETASGFCSPTEKDSSRLVIIQSLRIFGQAGNALAKCGGCNDCPNGLFRKMPVKSLR